MNRPHPLRSIKGHVCFSLLSNDRRIVNPSGAFLAPCRHEEWPQRSKYRVSAGPQGGDVCVELNVGLLPYSRMVNTEAEGGLDCYLDTDSRGGSL